MSSAVIACGAIASHIKNLIEREQLDLAIYPLPPLLHNHPEKIAGEVEAKIKELQPKYAKLAVAYADCGTYGQLDQVIDKYGIARQIGRAHV